MQKQQAEALANLATAKAADRQEVAELYISNATLTHELRAATATIVTLQQRLASCACAPTPRTGGKNSNGDRQTNNASTIQAATLRQWIQIDIVGHVVITSVGGTMEHRVTMPLQDIRVQLPYRIRWEEAQSTSRSDTQGRT